jgi:hypothetical protein
VTTWRCARGARNPQYPDEERNTVGPQVLPDVRHVSVDLVGRPTVDLLRTDSALCR